ncbi:MAG: hypothetical protein II359_03750 [Clostridia bacterium]|nr:hypothetical protein [Clostridia bacterium]
MYKITAPLMNNVFQRTNPEKTVSMLKQLGVERVFLALDTYVTASEKRKKIFDDLKANIAFLKQEGFEVGAWIWTFWLKEKNDYTHMSFVTGNESTQYICPSDEAFRTFAGSYIRDIAKCGPDLIMFDDDYRYGYLDGGQGCVCKNHRQYMEDVLGEKLPENFIDYLTSGKGNKYRSAWLSANRHYMLKFAEDMRAVVDEVDETIRMGVCACMSVWDFDGASPAEISKTLAGKTKPFLRLIGAPYWAVQKSWGNRLQDVIELERMERSWCTDASMEIFSEGDTFPRPRFNCPASYLEGFDTALRADGRFDGILKYAFDYVSRMDYETGYLKKHLDHQSLYKDIEEIFAPKEAVGVRVYEAMRKYEHANLYGAVARQNLADMFYSQGARMLAASSIPTVYEGTGICGIAFGENIKYVPKEAMHQGLILDIRAASILMEQGIDIGIREKKNEISATEEYFVAENEYVNVDASGGIYEMKLDAGAEVQSYFIHEGEKYPASYRYENNDGQKFLVFAFEGYYMPECLFRQYTRARQLIQNIQWLSEGKLPAQITGNPDLYVMTKQKEGKLAVGLWNFFADSIDHPEITLDREYKSIRYIGCEGTLVGNKVVLSKLAAFEFAGFEVE